MNSNDYERILKDMRTGTHKIANDIFMSRREVIMKTLKEHGIVPEVVDLKKGRPKK